MICNALMLCSYCVRAGKLAGDVECDEVFPNYYIRHTITIISHLVREMRRSYNDGTYCASRSQLQGETS